MDPAPLAGIKAGDGLAASVELEASASGRSEVNGKLGVGIGEIEKVGPDINIYKWNGWDDPKVVQ